MTDYPFGDVQPGVFPVILTETHADESTQPFWDGAKQDRLMAPRCTNCGTFRLPPEAICFQIPEPGSQPMVIMAVPASTAAMPMACHQRRESSSRTTASAMVTTG